MSEPSSAAPAAMSHEETEAFNSTKVTLADLCAKGTSNFALKNYSESADYYARASELQAELNGEMSVDNAEILFLYGRSLFKLGQGQSDVLGGRASGAEKKKSKGGKKEKVAVEKVELQLDTVAEDGVAAVAEGSNSGTVKLEDVAGVKKPLFQFTGDENFEDSDEEVEEADGDEEDDEDDDLAAAFEVLDLARVLYLRRLGETGKDTDAEKEKEKVVEDPATIQHIKERLADTHDILAEISLENERFPNAVSDFKESLRYKQGLYTKESEIIAEAHFKLSLALEFASITTTSDDEDSKQTQHIDEAMREEAAKELEDAIESTKLKLQNKEVELASTSSPDDNDLTRSQIVEVKEIVADMEQRLLDLRAPPVDINAALNGPAGVANGTNPMGGILGVALGESPAETQARIEEAKRTATDLTGLIRRKKDKAAETPEPVASGASTNGKRKVEDDADDNESVKKAKVEDAPEE